MGEKTPDQQLLLAAINCPHAIDDRKIVLEFDGTKPGNNALDQLGLRLTAAANALTAEVERPSATTVADLQSTIAADQREIGWLRERLATVNRHQAEEPDVWYWQNDGEDHLESMTNALPVVIRADQLRALVARPATGTPAGWRFTRIDDRSIEIVCPTFTTPLVVSLDVSDRHLRAFYNLAADILDASPA